VILLRQFAIYSVLGLTYLGLALGYLPGLRMNRATIALVGSAFLIALGVLRLQEAWDAIDATTILFLLSMMVVNANLSKDDTQSWLLLELLSIYPTPFRGVGFLLEFL
jgi:di/tricarboxylate transporter